MKRLLLIAFGFAFAGSVACKAEAPDPFLDPTFAEAHRGLIGPGGQALDQDPCPEAPGAQAGCEALVSARRISWYGYLAKWMQIYRVFGVSQSDPGSYASLPSEQLGLSYGHPDRMLAPLTDNGGSSQYVTFHGVLGEPMDDFGVEATTIAAFRGQHSLHLTAGAVKQACRISTYLAARLDQSVAAGIPADRAPLVDQLVERNGNQITAFKAQLGLVAFGRMLDASELNALNAAMGQGATFATALSALMCSTSALVE